jgi:hypothetical protein
MKKAILLSFVLWLSLLSATASFAQPEKEATTVIPQYIVYRSENEGSPKKLRKKEKLVRSLNKDFIALVDKGIKLNAEMHRYPNYREIERLAQEMGLDKPSEYNPKLILDIGDITYEALQGKQIEAITKKYAALKAFRDALDEEKITMRKKNDDESLKGHWDAFAEQMLSKTEIRSQLKAYHGQWDTIIENDRIISFLIDDNMIVVDYNRIREMGDKIDQAVLPDRDNMALNEVRKLAENYYQLDRELECNGHIFFDEGNYNDLRERYSTAYINKLLGTFKVLLDAAKYDNDNCFEFIDKGKLSWAAEEFILKRFYL